MFWPTNHSNNFTIKKYFFDAVILTSNTIKGDCSYYGHGIVFNGSGLQNFSNEFTQKLVSFDADNSQLKNLEISYNNFLVLGEGPTDEINDKISQREKRFSINFTE